MKCNVDKTKLNVENILKGYSANEIDFYLLCNGNPSKAPSIFNYLMELITNINEKSNDEYINKILVGIYSYIEFCNEIKFELDDEDIKKIKNIEEILKKSKKDENKNIINTINKITNLLKQNTLSESERELIENNLKLFELVDELKDKITILEVKVKLYEEKTAKLEQVKTNNQNLSKENKEISAKAQLISKINEQLSKEKEELEKIIKDNNSNIETLTKNYEETKNKLRAYTKQITLLESELTSTSNKLNEFITEQEKKSHESEIDNDLLSKLFEGAFTTLDLINITNYSKEEIIESLKRLKLKVNISNNHKKTIPVIYTINEPLISTGINTEIHNDKKVFNLLVTSDWHLKPEIEFSKTLNYVDSLYNYCVLNNINLIINLGDFLDIKLDDTRFNQYTSNMKLLEKIIELFPKDRSINHAILGGNHDMRMLKLGIDPLKYLEDNRFDFINLGYNDATISFVNSNSSEYIGIHHPNKIGLELDNIVLFQEYINDYLKKIYKDNDLNKKDVYLDLFGHFHLSRIDSNYILVPAYMKTNGQNKNGAWHFKIYFNEQNNIDYIVIKSIIPDRTLETINEYVYQKK